MKVELIKNDKADTVFVSFGGLGGNMVGDVHIDGEQRQEFYGLTKNYEVIFVIDENKSWYNTDCDFKQIVKLIDKKKRVIAIGNSMGGFGACILPHYTKVDLVITFSAQTLIHPRPKWDGRYASMQEDVDNWKHPNVEIVDGTQYYLHYGDYDRVDQQHIDFIPDKPNVHKIKHKDHGHNLAREFKEKNKLHSLIDEIING